MTNIFSIITRFAVITKATFTEALDDADTMADAALMGIMVTDQKSIDFWTRFYRVMYRTLAIVNMVLFGIMILKAIFGIDILFWMQWATETLCTRIYDHIRVQGVRVILRSRKLAKEDLTFNEFVNDPDFEIAKSRIDMVNQEVDYMCKEIKDALWAEFEASGLQEKHTILKNGTEVAIKRNSSGGIDWVFDFSEEAWDEAARRVAKVINQ